MNNHRGFAITRRDDLESLAYLLIYLYKGRLPWGPSRTDDVEVDDKILKKKPIIPPLFLCQGMPHQMKTVLKYVRLLVFRETPDCAFVKQLFPGVLEDMDLRNNGELDFVLDIRPKTWLKNIIRTFTS